MSAANFILSLARKLLARESKGITTIPNRMAAEQKAAEIVVKLENAGLPLNRANEFIRSEQDLIRILNMIENTPPVMREVPSGIRSTESAKVFDIKGKEIKDTKNIIGGEEVKETEGAIKSRLEKGNKEAAQKIRMKKMVDDAIDNMSPSLSGDTRTDAVLVAEDLAERMGMVYDDLPIREQTKLYDQAYQGLSNMRFEARQTPKGAPPKITSKKDADSQESSYDDGPADFDPDADNETFATGGRAGFKSGLGFKFLKFLNENNPVQAYKKYLQSVKTRAQENPKKLAPELAAVASSGIFVNRRMQDILKNMKEKDMENNLENFREELNKDPFYQKYPDLKDKVLENYTEKMFGEKRADGGRIGYFMGGPNPRGLGLLREILKYSSKTGKEQGKFKGADLSALDMLRLSNPKMFNRLLEDVQGKVNIKEGIMGTDTVRAQQQALRKQRKDITAGALKVAKDMKARDDAIAKRIAEEAEKTIIPRTKIMMMEGMGMSEEAAEKAARDLAKAGQNMRLIDDSPQITDEGLLQLENVLKNLETGGKKKRELNATGGRIGFKDGMTRRTFLKIFGGLVSLPIIGKVIAPLKLTKGVTKVPIIKTDNVPGKPEWFDALVNKVIIEGDDVTKKFATKEREIVHAKEIDKDNYVMVTQDLDEGVVRVEYDNPQATMFGEKVDLTYKKPPPDEGNPRPAGEFQTSETGMVGRAQGPEDYEIEVEGMSGRAIEDLESDVSKLKEYATGKKLTIKEILEAKKRKDKVRYYESPEGQSQYVIERQGEYDYSPDDGMASGGIARMLGE